MTASIILGFLSVLFLAVAVGLDLARRERVCPCGRCQLQRGMSAKQIQDLARVLRGGG